MIKDLTFKDVCKFIKEDNPKLIEKADTMLSAILIFSSIGLSQFSSIPVAPILSLMSTKNELVKLGKYLYEQITQKKDLNSLDRFRRMEVAYILICYTAFFEAHDDLLDAYPSIKEDLEIQLNEKIRIIERNSKSDQTFQYIESTSSIFLPNPTKNFQETQLALMKVYTDLAKALRDSIDVKKINEIIEPEKKAQKHATNSIFVADSNSEFNRLRRQVDALPEKAIKHFEAQYYELSSKYNEFFIWANLQEHKKTQKHTSDFLKIYSSSIVDLKKNIDIGLENLTRAVESIPHLIEKNKSDDVFNSLEKIYKKELEQPVIKDLYDKDKVSLNFPKKSEIFIPQSFKSIYVEKGNLIPLEDEETWRSVKSRDDLGEFLLSYLSSPYSFEAPLIILGHPGSGKSLLTQMLAAKFSLPVYSPIRVELRNINADNEIESQIEEQIEKDTGLEIKLAHYSKQLKDFPPIAILDGYDELLQASGKVFGNYLLKAQKLQERELNLERPLRIIITSRVTLIDKATIPAGSTIIKLEEFNAERRNKWIFVWNNVNADYFRQKQMKPFSLPVENKQILELAKQPLLLLMLALYDSKENKLLNDKNIKQTELYYNLLRRFVEREREKEEKYQELSEKDRKNEINKEIERLGVVALGMFNRRNLFVSTNQLNRDVAFFKLEKEIPDSPDRKLQQAEFILGSFFFVHKSKSRYKGEGMNEIETEAAFEFLHNTFGEFLTSDFMLDSIISEIEFLRLLSTNEHLKTQFHTGGGIGINHPAKWFACLSYTPLFSRPVILKMMQEWIYEKLSAKNVDRKEFMLEFNNLVTRQLNLLLTSDLINNSIKETCKDFCNPMSFWGHLAIYSINLVLIRIVLSEEDFVFERNQNSDGSDTWKQLTHLWRSWFSIENLNELTAILTSETKDKSIILKAKNKFIIDSGYEHLSLIQNVSSVLKDEVVSSLIQLFLDPFSFEKKDEALGNLDIYTLPNFVRKGFQPSISETSTTRLDIHSILKGLIETANSSEISIRLRTYETTGILINLYKQDFLHQISDIGFSERFRSERVSLFMLDSRRKEFTSMLFEILKSINFSEFRNTYPDFYGIAKNFIFEVKIEISKTEGKISFQADASDSVITYSSVEALRSLKNELERLEKKFELS